MIDSETEKHVKDAAMDPIGFMTDSKAVMAPMAGITDIPFRSLARENGCRFAFTEMLDVNGILYNNKKSFGILNRIEGDDPLGVQVVGQDEEKLSKVVKICEEMGFPVVDLNAGCPARKVIKAGKGAALLKNPVKLGNIIRRLSASVTIPVTVKIRSGWGEDSVNYKEIARAAEENGAKAICVHSRTREQMYKGKADRKVISEVKASVKIPVFASGNVLSPENARDILLETGCDGVFVARGALGQPWVFRQIKELLSGINDYYKPNLDEIKTIIKKHYSLSLKYFGKRIAGKRMYKHLSWYLKGYKNLNEIMNVYLSIKGRQEFEEFIDRVKVKDSKRLCYKDK